MPAHYILKIAYDGRPFLGWQKTIAGPSVEESLEHALIQILQEPIIIRAASRTDRGVHAHAQIVDIHPSKQIHNFHIFRHSLNCLLPKTIRCLQIYPAPYPHFHPTLDAQKKTYQYCIFTGPVHLPLLQSTHWHIPQPIDLDLIQKCAQQCIGTHDFRGLCNTRKNLNEQNTHRTVYALNIMQQHQELIVHICANTFLYKMARNIVGTLIWIGLKKIPCSALLHAIETRKRAFAGITAPAHGLSLLNLNYGKKFFC